jgi:ComF family protein
MAAQSRVSGWRAVVRVLRSTTERVVDDVVTVMFPADCRCCGGPLLQAGPVPVCDACVRHLRRSDLASCWQCGEAIAPAFGFSGSDLEDMRFAWQMAESLRCRACRMAEPKFVRAVSYGVYTDELRSLIGLMKFDSVPGLRKILGAKLAEAMLQLEPLTAREVLVIAVPLAKARQAQRGYNQSVLLADEALKLLRRSHPQWKLTAEHGALRRVRQTEAQYVLSLTGRRRNLRGAFLVADDVAGEEVLLVDDIMTSGATARECARVLKAAGAAKVWVATVARAQKHEFVRHEHEREPEQQVARWDAN